jgi:high affinity Mn2+ porin
MRKNLVHNLLRIAFFFLLLFSVSEKIKAQANDEENHYKGLLANRFDSLQKWSVHFQFTDVWQTHPPFSAQYSGKNSLLTNAENAMSVTSTLYFGRKLWRHAAFFIDPEVAGGRGLSSVFGMAGASNGETFRVGSPAPAVYMARCFFEQHISLRKSKTEHRRNEQNQISDSIPTSRITISVGKFSLADFFDDNAYSHDPRSEFMNWALMDNGAWDYPANTRGYTWGAVVELIEPGYSIRLATSMVPKNANGPTFDTHIQQANGNTAEFEKKFKIKNHAGNLRLLGFANFSSAPSYINATNQLKKGDSTLVPVISGQVPGVMYGALKYGFGISFNQEIVKNLGIFARASWSNGQTAAWAFTPIDQSVSLGIRIKGEIIKRPKDHFGIAYVANGASFEHRNYLNAGGYDFMLGDGKLPHYGLEHIMETFYKVNLMEWLWVTGDYQLVVNPAYNKDRGPASIFSIRTHVEF